jgi:hypothetical protein
VFSLKQWLKSITLEGCLFTAHKHTASPGLSDS